MKKFLLFLAGAALSTSAALAADPVFPSSFEIELSAEGPKVTQGIDQGVFTISITGKCPESTITVALGVPEGYDGFIGLTDTEYEPEIGPLKFKAPEVEWIPIDGLLNWGMKKGNKLTFDIDGMEHQGQLYLYKGDLVDYTNQISFELDLEQGEPDPEPELEFPATFGVTMNVEGPVLTVNGTYISVTGECAEKEVTLTVEVPEGWDGMLAFSDTDLDPDFELFAKKISPDAEWNPIKALLSYGFKDSNSLTFPVDGEEHIGQFYLYKDDKVYMDEYLSIEFEVSDQDLTVVKTIEAAEGAARYFDLTGAEVVNPVSGLYVKVIGNKASKVLVK